MRRPLHQRDSGSSPAKHRRSAPPRRTTATAPATSGAQGSQRRPPRERQRERAHRRGDAPRPQRERDHRHHVERALRRHREAGEQRVAERADDRGERRALRAGSRSASRGTRRQPTATSQAARPETSVTCSPEMLIRCVTPVRLKRRHSSARDRALVADRERGEDARGRRRAEVPLEAVAHRFSRLLDPVEDVVSTPSCRCTPVCLHISGRADAALEQPCLVVEAVRIDVAVRPAQPHRQQPALARMHLALEQRRLLFAEARAAIPGQQDLLRQPLAVRRRLDLELEAQRRAPCRAGRLETTPTTSRSRPSSSGASQSAMRTCAQAAAQRKPAANASGPPIVASTQSKTDTERQAAQTQPDAGSAACSCSNAAPAANARAARVIYNATRPRPPADRAPQVLPQVPAQSSTPSARNRWWCASARWLQHPNLWYLNRRSVPGALAIGLFAGLIRGRCRCWSRCCSPCRCARTSRWRWSRPSTPTPSPSCRCICSPTATATSCWAAAHRTHAPSTRLVDTCDWSELDGAGQAARLGLLALALTLATSATRVRRVGLAPVRRRAPGGAASKQ